MLVCGIKSHSSIRKIIDLVWLFSWHFFRCLESANKGQLLIFIVCIQRVFRHGLHCPRLLPQLIWKCLAISQRGGSKLSASSCVPSEDKKCLYKWVTIFYNLFGITFALEPHFAIMSQVTKSLKNASLCTNCSQYVHAGVFLVKLHAAIGLWLIFRLRILGESFEGSARVPKALTRVLYESS